MIFSKILFSLALFFPFGNPSSNSFGNISFKNHPFYVSVTQIEENAKEKILEVSCKIFTDDFEKTLRMHYKDNVDLLNPADQSSMNKKVNDYISQHLKISIDGKAYPLIFLGYEQNEEAVECYFQVNNVSVNKSVSVFNNILFEYKPEQTNIVHVTVRGKRKSRQLINPDARTGFDF